MSTDAHVGGEQRQGAPEALFEDDVGELAIGQGPRSRRARRRTGSRAPGCRGAGSNREVFPQDLLGSGVAGCRRAQALALFAELVGDRGGDQVALERYGNADAVQVSDVPDPQPGDDDVLVRIQAASINPLDLKIRDGDVKVILPYRTPFVLGNDLAGVVVAVGARVTRFVVGDEVYLFMVAGGDQLRELAALIDAGTIRPVVDRVFDFEATREALAYVEQGHPKAGKVVVRMK